MEQPIKRARSDDLIEQLNKKIIEISSLEEESKKLKQDYEQYFKTFMGFQNSEKFIDDLKLKLTNACTLAENCQEITLLCETHKEIHQSYYKYNEKCKKVTKDIEKFIEQLNFDLRFLYSFQSKRAITKLWIFDINNRKSKNSNFKIKRGFDTSRSSAQVIELPNSQLFYYEPWFFKSYPVIIDARTYQIKKRLPTGPGHSIKGGVYYKNSIFLFGGNNSGADLNLAVEFNLNRNRWLKIPKLMSPSDSCSYIVYKDSILICGFNHRKLYRFDLNINSYSDIDVPGIGRQMNKTLMLADSNVYIIFYTFYHNIIFCENWAKNSWVSIGKFNLPFYEYSYFKFSKGSIFMWLTNKNYRACYAFNLEKRKLEEFSNIEYL